MFSMTHSMRRQNARSRDVTQSGAPGQAVGAENQGAQGMEALE